MHHRRVIQWPSALRTAPPQAVGSPSGCLSPGMQTALGALLCGGCGALVALLGAW